MKPLRHPLVAGPGCRTPQTLLLIDERAALLRDAAARFYPGCSDREIARRLRTALLHYQGGRWQRERADLTCPKEHEDKLTAVLWMLLKVRDFVPSERTTRAALSQADVERGYVPLGIVTGW